MANATVNRIGQINQANATDALFLKLYAGEVLTAFEKQNVTLGRHQVRTISQGKSAQFPALGRTTTGYHTPGTEIVGQQTNFAEVVITIDDLLIAHQFLANIDEVKNHYDVRGPLASEMGAALANQMDAHVLQTMILAARGANVVSGLPGGKVIYTDETGAPSSANWDTKGADLAWAIFKAAEVLDNNFVPQDGRVCFVKPAQYNALILAKDTINRDWGGSGTYAGGDIQKIAGIEIVKAPTLPAVNVSNGTTAAGTGNKYAGDFSKTSAVVVHTSAVGTVKLLDLGMESAYDIRRQGTLMVGKYAVGHGVLRPDAAVEISNQADPS